MTLQGVAGLDIGSTSIKLLVTSMDGQELLVEHVATPWATSHGQTEMSADDALRVIFELFCRTDSALQSRYGNYGIAGIGVSGMAEAGVLLDHSDSPVTPVIAWFDPRGRQEMQASPQSFRAEFPGRTGLPVGPTATIAKLLHLKAGGLTLAPHRWLNLPEFVVHKLGGDAVSEYSLASRTGLLDQDTGQPWQRALDLLDVPTAFLPGAATAGDPVGTARHLQLPQAFRGAILTVAGHDHLVSAVAAGATSSEQVYDSMGTAEALVRILDGPLPGDARARLAATGINALRHVVPGKYVLLASTRSGLLMRRVLHLLGISDPAGRSAIDSQTMALPDNDAAGPGCIEVSGARNDDGMLRIRVNGDNISPAQLFAATLAHGNKVCAELIEVMDREVPPAVSALLTGGWAQLQSVRRARQLVLPMMSHSQRSEDTAFGAALFAAFATSQDSAEPFSDFAARFGDKPTEMTPQHTLSGHHWPVTEGN